MTIGRSQATVFSYTLLAVTLVKLFRGFPCSALFLNGSTQEFKPILQYSINSTVKNGERIYRVYKAIGSSKESCPE